MHLILYFWFVFLRSEPLWSFTSFLRDSVVIFNIYNHSFIFNKSDQKNREREREKAGFLADPHFNKPQKWLEHSPPPPNNDLNLGLNSTVINFWLRWLWVCHVWYFCCCRAICIKAQDSLRDAVGRLLMSGFNCLLFHLAAAAIEETNYLLKQSFWCGVTAVHSSSQLFFLSFTTFWM